MRGKSMLHPTKRSSADDIVTVQRAIDILKARGQVRKYGGGLDDVMLAEEATMAFERLVKRLEPRQPSLF